jgi:hypothetical protein
MGNEHRPSSIRKYAPENIINKNIDHENERRREKVKVCTEKKNTKMSTKDLWNSRTEQITFLKRKKYANCSKAQQRIKN